MVWTLEEKDRIRKSKNGDRMETDWKKTKVAMELNKTGVLIGKTII